MYRILLAAVVFAGIFGVEQSGAEPKNNALDDVRGLADGAGPTHLFWLSSIGGGAEPKDILAVIDPLFAAIRLYTVARPSQNIPLQNRFSKLGVCGLPIDFRPWQIYHHKNTVHIESMPDPRDDAHKTKPEAFRSTVYTVRRDLVSNETAQKLKDAGDRIATTSWNPAQVIQCGSSTGGPGLVGRAAPFTAKRDPKQKNRTIVIENSPEALAPPAKLTVTARTGGEFRLYSARELEPAGKNRVVLITEGGLGSDGLSRFRQRVLTFAENVVDPVAEREFDETLLRSKLGHRPLAVMPGGEILAMGFAGKAFKILSCGTAGVTPQEEAKQKPGAKQKAADPLCGNADNGIQAQIEDQPDPEKEPAPSKTKNRASTLDEIFGRVREVTVVPWSVDASKLPRECRGMKGCEIKPGDPNFVPLRGIRLTDGVYSQTGAPYAQTDSLQDFDTFMSMVQNKADAEERFSASLANVFVKIENLPGNLNDPFNGDIGIDCSALLQVAWNGRNKDKGDRLDTEALQNGAVSYRCPHRVKDVASLRGGDAIGLNVASGPKHVVIYAQKVSFDGANESWQVLESASACDGVCWSVYDPSFFNGWGLYRASTRDDVKCPPRLVRTRISKESLPHDFEGWREMVRPKKL